MNQLNRTIDACRDAGLPVVDERDCTCGLRGRLVVVARAGSLEVIWPYDRCCPIHGLRDLDVPRRGASLSVAATRRSARRENRSVDTSTAAGSRPSLIFPTRT